LVKQKTDHTFFLCPPKVLSPDRLRMLIEGAQSKVVVMRPWISDVPFFSRHVLLPLRFLLCRADVFFSPFGQLPFGWFKRSVITVHDVAIYEHPEWFSALPNQDFSTRVIVPRSIRRADRLLAVSRTTAERVVRLFPSVAAKTAVVYEGVQIPKGFSFDATSKRFPFDRDVILSLGTIEPRKNLTLAIEAFDLFLRQHPECATTVRFVIAGKKGWGTEEVFRLVEEVNRVWLDLEPEGVIQFLGTVSEEEKWTLLARASVFVFPSFDEGFGLPVLEAMAVGTPVIASRSDAVVEVGGDAVMCVDDAESFALAMAQCVLLPEGVKMLRQDGLDRARQFSWEKTAKETLKMIEDVGKVGEI
jgi:glycosyltransferase involved in cell wall biosynthesis